MSFEGSRAVLVKDLSGNILQISGGALTVGGTITATADVSGSTIAIWNASGRNAAYLTNQAGSLPIGVAVISVDTQSQNVNALITAGHLHGHDTTHGTWKRLKVTVSGSAASQDGLEFRLKVDTTQAGSNLKTGAFLVVTGLSGGVPLAASGVTIHGISIKNISGVNSAIHVGSSGNPPYVSGGYVLYPQSEKEFKVYNPAFIRVFAVTSGATVSWAGVDF